MPDVQIIFGMSAAAAERVTAAYCGSFGYQASTIDADGNVVPNPMTPAQFAQSRIVESVRQTVIRYEQGERIEQVKSEIVDDVNSIPVTIETV